MKKVLILFIVIVCFQTSYSQSSIKMKCQNGLGNEDINSLMLFEDIELENINFEGSELINKMYEVSVKEFRKGKLVQNKKVFSLEGLEDFKIDSNKFSLKLWTKIYGDKLKLFVVPPHFFSNKFIFKLKKGQGQNYALKNFQGTKVFVQVPLNKEFPVLGVITPVEVEKGMFTYCEVAQSGVAPEKFWEVFKIPHYFVIYMKFI
jgi:hypothetical protein